MKNKNQKESKPSRKLYQSMDQTRTFEEWVNKLELKNSYFFSFLVFIDRKFSLKNIGIWSLFSLCFSFLLFSKFDYQSVIYEGDIASADIKSPMNLTMVDVLTTESKKEVARKNILSVFKYVPLESEQQLDQVYNTFLKFRRFIIQKRTDLLNKEDFEKSLGLKVSDRTFEWLIEVKFDTEIDNTLRAVLENWASQFLADSPEKHILTNQKYINLLSAYREKTDESRIPVDSLKDIYRRSVLKQDLPMRFNKLSKMNQNKVLDLAFDLLRPNVIYDAETTEKRRNLAVEEILPATISIKKNQTIVSAGSIISLADVKIVNQIRKSQYEGKRGLVPVGVAVLFLLFITISANLIGAFKAIERNLDYRTNILFLVSLVSLGFWKILLFVFETSLVQKFGGSYPEEVLVLATPFAAPIIISGLITRSPYLLFMFTLFSSVAFAFLSDQSFPTFMIVILSSLAAIRTIYACEKRNDVYISAFYAALVAFAMSIIFLYINQPERLTSFDSWWLLFAAGFVGAALSSVLVFVLVPVIESIFEFSTDLKLLDLASMNHPLLREMMVKAPGTYHHSMVVGSMCEAAARTVGADALLNKVMGYFHDIGKMEHPTYFIENQRPGENPHDHISPHLSKTIIVAHVKDGVEMAIKAKLGQEIIDGIKQHHGTTLVSYFYNRAMKIAEKPEDVKEEEFRYPGPKPQFKESAILMLADSIEAAARAMDDPNPIKLSHLVENMVEKKIMDSQLDECDLNFVELTMIRKSFYRTILGVYHHRVDYKDDGSDKKVVDKSAHA
jgi:cyclic-di-AMP phosphodiesterase PgpH